MHLIINLNSRKIVGCHTEPVDREQILQAWIAEESERFKWLDESRNEVYNSEGLKAREAELREFAHEGRIQRGVYFGAEIIEGLHWELELPDTERVHLGFFVITMPPERDRR